MISQAAVHRGDDGEIYRRFNMEKGALFNSLSFLLLLLLFFIFSWLLLMHRRLTVAVRTLGSSWSRQVDPHHDFLVSFYCSPLPHHKQLAPIWFRFFFILQHLMKKESNHRRVQVVACSSNRSRWPRLYCIVYILHIYRFGWEPWKWTLLPVVDSLPSSIDRQEYVLFSCTYIEGTPLLRSISPPHVTLKYRRTL